MFAGNLQSCLVKKIRYRHQNDKVDIDSPMLAVTFGILVGLAMFIAGPASPSRASEDDSFNFTWTAYWTPSP